MPASRYFRERINHGSKIKPDLDDERQHVAQIARQPINHLGAPPERLLASKDLAADLPVEDHQLAVCRERCTVAGSANTGFQVFEELPVSVNCEVLVWRNFRRAAGARSADDSVFFHQLPIYHSRRGAGIE